MPAANFNSTLQLYAAHPTHPKFRTTQRRHTHHKTQDLCGCQYSLNHPLPESLFLKKKDSRVSRSHSCVIFVCVVYFFSLAFGASESKDARERQIEAQPGSQATRPRRPAKPGRTGRIVDFCCELSTTKNTNVATTPQKPGSCDLHSV